MGTRLNPIIAIIVTILFSVQMLACIPLASSGPMAIMSRDSSRADPTYNDTPVHDKKVVWSFNDPLSYASQEINISNGAATLRAVESWLAGTDASTGISDHTAVRASDTGVIYVYGGTDWSTNSNALWSYNASNTTWTRLADGPGARSGHAAVWDPVNMRMVIMGGRTALADYTTALSEVWVYYRDNNTWVQLPDAPFAAADHAMALHQDGVNVYVMGGANASGCSNNVWNYKLDTLDWQNMTASGGPPSVRAGHTMIYRGTMNYLLVFGGYSGSAVLGDMWAYYITNHTWVPRKNGPPVRWQHGMAQDTPNSRIIIYAGKSSGPGVTTGYLKDLWAFYPMTDMWIQLQDRSPPRAYHAMFYDGSRDLIVIVAGYCDNGAPTLYKDIPMFNSTYVPFGKMVATFDAPRAPLNIYQVHWSGDVPQPGVRTNVTFNLSTSNDSVTWTTQAVSNDEDPWVLGKYLKWEMCLFSYATDSTPSISSLTITLQVNNRTVANAGPDKSVFKGRVDLSGMSSNDTDNDWLQFFWNQTAGPAVTLQPTNTSPAPYFTATVAGNYTFVLDISDGFEWTHDEVNVTVKNKVPTIALAETIWAVAMEEVSLTATGQDTDGGNITKWEWDLGDGGKADGQSVTHTYAKAGIYNAKVTVTDNEGGIAFDTATVNVNNSMPVAMLAVNRTTVEQGQAVLFNASGSYDKDGNVTDLFYDFGDGNKTTWVKDKVLEHIYTEAGTYKATLDVRDDSGDRSKAMDSVNINVIHAKTPPAASFNVKPATGTNLTTFSFTSTSMDEDGNIVGFEWIFGDGGDQTGGIELSTVGHKFERAGNYTVVLKVTDDDGLVGTANVSVTVTELPNQPSKVIIRSPVAGTTITVTTLDLAGTASDPDGSIEYIEVQVDALGWARANGTSSWTYTWDGANLSDGPHTISARAYDGRVYSDIASFNVTIKKDDGGDGDGGNKNGPGFEAASMVIALIVVVFVGTAMVRRRGGRNEMG